MLVDGELVEGTGAIDVVNPATGRAFARCPVADRGLLDKAVEAAGRAFPDWARRAWDERAGLVRRLADALEAEKAAFARQLTEEQGKPLPHAEGEILRGAATLRTFADMTLDPLILRENQAGRVVEHRSPLGVVAAITPWNFPIILLASKLAPALVAGNTLVVKPAPTTPLTTLMLARLCAEIFPRGVVNVICDANDLGNALTSHPGVAKVAFTGSTATGRKVMASAAETIKRLTLELGGNDAAIGVDDVDPVEAAGRGFTSAMLNSGQVCVAIKRAYVPAAMYDPFCDELVRLAEAVIVDDGMRQGTQLGPVQNEAQYERLKKLLEETEAEGNVVAGGGPLDRPGYFIAPTIVRDIADDARLVREEQFGPVLPVLSYTQVDDAIARANASEYGLAATVWGSDTARALDVAGRVEAGTVWVNQHMAIDPAIPFGGAKQSGMGTELGIQGLREYTQAKIVNLAF